MSNNNNKNTNKSKKTIIQVWTHSYANCQHYWGIGDTLRGTIQLYDSAKKRNFNFYVDFQFHVMSKYLKNPNNPYADLIKNNQKNIKFVDIDQLEGFIDNDKNYVNYNNNNIIFLFTSAFYRDDFYDEMKEFMKNLLTPNDEFSKYIDNRMKEIPYDKYNILHYRLGDYRLIGNKDNESIHGEKTLNTIIQTVTNNMEPCDILVSDSIKFKEIIHKDTKNFKNLFMFKTNVKHIGYHKNDDMKETLFEFFVITKACKIKTFSVYYWTSGFTYWISKIYDIPLIEIHKI